MLLAAAAAAAAAAAGATAHLVWLPLLLLLQVNH
jgi:hypothetical protein